MATHLRAALLRRALKSVLAQDATQLAQLEIIVVADALDAETGEELAELLRPQDQFLRRNGTPGPAESRNAAFKLARGDWLMFLDDDDTWTAGHLARVDEVLRGDASGHPCWYSDTVFQFEDRGLDQGAHGVQALRQEVLDFGGRDAAQIFVKNFIPNNTLIFRRSLLDGLTVDPHLASQEDWDFLLGAATRALPRHYRGGGAIVHKDVNPGTRRGSQNSSNDQTVILDFLHVYRRWPAPTPELKAQRQALLKSVGLDLPVNWF
ncbi:MAG: glycosyltransferase [Paucibacter sp.]|nr:glycosyltransferase [Roseateles sp.]